MSLETPKKYSIPMELNCLVFQQLGRQKKKLSLQLHVRILAWYGKDNFQNTSLVAEAKY